MMFENHEYQIFLRLVIIVLSLGLLGVCNVVERVLPEPTATPNLATATPIPPMDDVFPDSLEDVQWSLISYADRKGNQVAVLPDTEITILFTQNQVNGKTGCNRFFGIYQLREQRLTLIEAGITELFCMEPDGIMEQENTYVATLASVASFSIVNKRLQLIDEQGRTILIFRRR
jgi:heat shock protein HslJ